MLFEEQLSFTVHRHLTAIHLQQITSWSKIKYNKYDLVALLYVIKMLILGKTNLKILLIEDDTIEVMKLKRAVKKLEMNHTLIEAKNGEEALSILKDDNILPDIIFLDLNMPKINGLEFLKILKKDDVLKFLPTIILTTSSNRRDVLACYSEGVAGYIIKPLKYEDYVAKIETALNYWAMNELIKA